MREKFQANKFFKLQHSILNHKNDIFYTILATPQKYLLIIVVFYKFELQML